MARADWLRHILIVAVLFLTGLGAGYGYVHFGMSEPVEQVAGSVESYCRSAVSGPAVPESRSELE